MTVRKHDANLDGPLNDVIVGYDHAVRRDDDAAPLGLRFPDLAARRAPTFTTRTLTTEGRTKAIVFVAGEHGGEPYDGPTEVSSRGQRLVRRDVHLGSHRDTGVRAIGV
jgi:hypothetical protein